MAKVPTVAGEADAPAPMNAIQRGTLIATGLGLFMIFLDALIVNVALPDIQAHFDVGESGLQWMVTAYSLGMAVFMMTSASIADRFGRRRVYVGGLAVFTMASMACGLAPSIEVVNVARGVQGLGAAAANVTSLALVSAAFEDEALKARAIGIWTAIAAIGLALGPTLGGVLTQEIGWRSVFFVNLIFGLAAIVLTYRFVSESKDPKRPSLDLVGQVLYIVAVGGFAFAIIQGPHSGWSSPEVLVAFALFAVALPTFIRQELHTDEPMMDVRLFTNRTYTLAIVTIFASLFGAYGMLLVVTQLWQNVRDYSVLATGLLLLPFGLGQIILAPRVGRWVGRTGARRLMLFGLVLLCVGFAIAIIGVDVQTGVVVLGAATIGVGLAFTMTPSTTVAMAAVPEDRAGMASGIMSSQRALGSTAGYAVLGTVLAAWLGATLNSSLETAIPDASEREAVTTQMIDEANPHAYTAEIGPGRPVPEASTATQDEIAAAADDDFARGIQLAMATALGLIFVVLIVDWRGIPPDGPMP